MTLRLSQVRAGYGAIRALHGVSLTLQPGEIVTLIGANGAGKSTTLRAICGLLDDVQGNIDFEGKSLINLSPEKIAAMGVCQAPEGRRIFAQLTVMENLEMGAYLRRDREGVRRDMDYCFSLFPVLKDRRRQPGGSLSGGEQQMLAISRALLQRPRALLLDEPSLGLAPLIVRRIFEVITRINEEQNVGILLVEQNANLALRAAHRAYVLENGKIAMQGAAQDLLKDEAVQRAYLGAGKKRVEKPPRPLRRKI